MNRTRIRKLLWTLTLTATALGAFSMMGVAQAADVPSTIEGFRYSPSPLRVQKGDKVNYTNKDTQPHTITSKTPGLFDVPIAANGGTASLTAPSTDGVYDIICTLHPAMAGQLIVGAAPAAPGTGTGLATGGGGIDGTLLALGLGAMAVAVAAGGTAVRLRK
ncbi:MAG: cupredoxin domain-containing protein [Dehalococcoidia bacterium]